MRLEASRTQPGSGLGLSLASAVATLHGGQLRLGDGDPGLRATLAIPALAGDALAVPAAIGKDRDMTFSRPATRTDLLWLRVSRADRSCLRRIRPHSGFRGLGDLAPAEAAAISAIIGQFPCASDILHGIAEASPYLFDLVRADAARLTWLLQGDPDRHLADLIEATTLAVTAAADEAEVMRLLRRMKAEAALLIALCDIGDVWPVLRVTQALTDVAVESCQAALRYLLRQEAARGRLVPPCLERPEEGSGLVVLAMGKLGAGELNYSSDIDLIVLYDRDAPTLAPDGEPQAVLRPADAAAWSHPRDERTADGYVFRTDLRLRPGSRRRRRSPSRPTRR